MVKFLVEHGACIFATTLSDRETAAEKCEEEEEGPATPAAPTSVSSSCFCWSPNKNVLNVIAAAAVGAQTSSHHCSIQEKLGIMNNGEVFAVYDYKAHRSDELDFSVGTRLAVLRRGDDFEMEWWWCQTDKDGYVPRNLLGLYPRVTPMFNLEVSHSMSTSQESIQLTAPQSSVSLTQSENTIHKTIPEEDEDVPMSS